MKPKLLREEWLNRLVELLRPTFSDNGKPLPKKIRVSCGWPSHGGRGGSKRVIGQAWSAECSSDGTHETFISPVLEDPSIVGATLVHELVHHAVGVKKGHKRPFRTLALAVGLEGKMTATVAGKDQKDRLETLCSKLGAYPHAALDPTAGPSKKQSTRMLKVECQRKECGCILRMTKKWIEEVGTPRCACGGTMREEEVEGDDE